MGPHLSPEGTVSWGISQGVSFSLVGERSHDRDANAAAPVGHPPSSLAVKVVTRLCV